MGFLFLDIESLMHEENPATGLNPYMEYSEVLVIAYNYYDLKTAPKDAQIKKPTFLYSWKEGGEEELLKKFYKFLETISKDDPFLKIIGFNHLAYDLPFLLARMSELEIGTKQGLFDLLFTSPRHIDLSQLAMGISEDTKRDEDFRCISQKRINAYFDIFVKEASGADVSTFYYDKRYDLIEKYVTEEFTFEQLYNSILDYFIYVK
jgi:hypothetical protein